jgi:hypothetical protein
MECPERTLLLERCAATMQVYIKASIKWQELTSKPNTQEYQHSLRDRVKARNQVDLATYELEQHENLHRCYPATATLN